MGKKVYYYHTPAEISQAIICDKCVRIMLKRQAIHVFLSMNFKWDD
jgi:hypothetical protein